MLPLSFCVIERLLFLKSPPFINFIPLEELEIVFLFVELSLDFFVSFALNPIKILSPLLFFLVFNVTNVAESQCTYFVLLAETLTIVSHI